VGQKRCNRNGWGGGGNPAKNVWVKQHGIARRERAGKGEDKSEGQKGQRVHLSKRGRGTREIRQEGENGNQKSEGIKFVSTVAGDSIVAVPKRVAYEEQATALKKKLPVVTTRERERIGMVGLFERGKE